MIYTFYEQDMPKVYSDFIIKYNNEIRAISLIGTEIAIKAYRAKFLDNNMAKRSLPFFMEAEGDKYPRRIYKPGGTFINLPAKKTEQGYQVFMYSENLIFGLSQEDMITNLYKHLYDLNIPCPTPGEAEYAECLGLILENAKDLAYFVKCEGVGDIPEDAQFFYINQVWLSEFRDNAAEIISRFIIEEIDSEEILTGIEGIADYIERYSPEIGEKIGERITYLHTPGKYNNDVFDRMGRTLFPQQKDIAVAASKRLDVEKSVLISGQMGVGKSTLGIAICQYHCNEKPYRTIVTCPGHLVEKWAREVQTVLPDAVTYTIGNGKMKPWQEFYAAYRYSAKNPLKPEYWIVSNEALRGSYITRPGYTTKKIKVYDVELQEHRYMDVCTCPKCGKILKYPEKDDNGDTVWVNLYPVDFETHTTLNHKCRECEEVLWQADNNRKGYRKVSIGDLIKKRIPKDYFRYYISDEIHKYKGSTAQGLAFGGLIAKCSYTIGMTGTLADGYANGLYYLLWRMNPKKFKALGYGHNEESRSKFQMEYGFWQKTIKSKDSTYGKSSKAKNTRTQLKLLPGYTINTFPEWLLEATVFLKLSDVAPYLPSKTEFVNSVEMDEDLAQHYKNIEQELKNSIKEGGSQMASIMLHTCLSYPDLANGPDAISVEKPDFNFYLPLPELDQTKLYNKERELQSILEAELALGRKCLVFTAYTNRRDCLARLEWVANQAPGARVQVVRSNTVNTRKREAYVKGKLNGESKNILICHPELVETGLDLLECPTIIWMQTGYVPSTVRQASARSWRIGQEQEVKVIFLCYQDTLQEKCFQLIGSKLNAAGILEGSLTNEGLRSFGDSGDIVDILSMLKDNIVTLNSNEIFESYKAEVATLINKKVLTIEDTRRLKTLSEILAEEEIDLSQMSKSSRKRMLQQADSQLVLFA